MSQKPSIPKGTRDFGPEQMMRRTFIFDKIREVFLKYGYQPLETPAMETLDTLLGKYGDEGDRLIFKILNSGQYLAKLDNSEKLYLTDHVGQEDSAVSQWLTGKISEKALRYDLTVPFARYVVQNRNEISFPFKRFQIQPVWRADRPQKGRYREFYQCDADVIGSDSLLNEAELIHIIDEVFNILNIRISIKINNRKILAGIAEFIGYKDKITDITVAIDKLEKIGLEKVKEELADRGIPARSIDQLQPVFELSGGNEEKLNNLREILHSSEIGLRGIEEITRLLGYLKSTGIENRVDLDLTLARGLTYYTGAIIEVKAMDIEIGSICGGGRYDDLTGIFGLPGVSGVGISFGADRIYDTLEQLNAFPPSTRKSSFAIFLNLGETEISWCLPLAAELRKAGIPVEIYPDPAKMKKQLSYANQHSIHFAIMAGETEIANNEVSVKNMETGEQVRVSLIQLADYFKNQRD